ncbi:PQQ-binding-like beta-propeller repeat protein [Chloroflexota bacterium]
MLSRGIKPLALKLALLTVVVSLVIVTGGCIGLGGTQAGWSGVVADNGSIYFASSGGELIKKSAENGSQEWFIPFEAESSGSLLGCGGGTTVIPIYGTPAIEGEKIYVATFSGSISAFNTDGASIWEYPGANEDSHAFIGGPVVGNGKVYAAAANGIIYALDANTGGLLWKMELEEDVWAAPSIQDNALYIGTYNKKVYALDAESGERLWQQPFETNGPIVSTPLLDNGRVYVASFDRHIYALDAASGELEWKFPQTEGNGQNTPQKWFWASTVLYNSSIYAASMDGNVYVLEAASGSLVTVIELGSAVSATPVAAGDKIFIATREGNLFYIDTGDNSRRELPQLGGKVTAPLTTSDSVVYIHTQEDEMIYAINADSGVPLWNDTITE